MNKAPKISIIVPNFNHAKFLQVRLDSIFDQTFQNFEVILLDDASTDGSQRILEQYREHPKVSQLVINNENSGSPLKQWQKGIALAKGEYIWIAESDDFCEPNFLESMVQYFDKDVSLVYCASMNVDEQGKSLGLNDWGFVMNKERWASDYRNKGIREIRNYLNYRNIIINSSAVVFKKDAIANVILPTTMKFCGDWLIWREILVKGDLQYISTPLNYFRRHSSTSRSSKDLDMEKIRFREYFFMMKRDQSLLSRLINIRKYDWIIDEWLVKKEVFDNFSAEELQMPYELRLSHFLRVK